MHRLNELHRPLALLLCSVGLLGACKSPERIPIKTVPIGTGAPPVDNDGTKSTPVVPASHNANNECFSDRVDDLDGTVRGGDCDADPPVSYAMANRLGVKVTLSAPDVAPGGRVDVRMVFENLSKEKLPVYFYRDPTVHFPLLAVNSRGHDVTYPEGGLPETFAGSTARIVLAPKGTIHVKIPFEAVRFKWKKNGKDRELIEAGGLPKGDYMLRVRFPLAGNVGKAYAKYDVPLRVK